MNTLSTRSLTFRTFVTLSAVLVVLAVAGARPSAAARTVPPEAVSIPPAVTVTHGPTDRPRIALTFDDNYQLPQAYETLRILTSEHVPATMFVIGHYEDLGPDLTKQLAKGDFEIGDHTRSHANCPTLSWRALMIEIGAGTRTFQKATGKTTSRLFRPPGGFTDEFVARAAAAQGFRTVVLWDIDTKDWKGTSAAAIRNQVLSQAHNGAIVLLHLAGPHTAEALPGIISGLRNKGYELVTVTDLLKGDRRFIDVDPATADGKTILRMIDAGYLEPVDGDYFGSSDPVTRAQLARAMVSVGLPASTGDAGEIDYRAVAASTGLLGLASPGTYDETPINRLQLAQVLARVARTKGYGTPGGHPSAGGSVAADAEATVARLTDVPAYARADVTLAVSLGLISPKSESRFGVFALPQRRHLAIITARLQDLPVVGSSTLHPASDATTTDASRNEVRGTISSGLRGRVLRGGGTWIAALLAAGGLLVSLRLRAVVSRRQHSHRQRARARSRREHA